MMMMMMMQSVISKRGASCCLDFARADAACQPAGSSSASFQDLDYGNRESASEAERSKATCAFGNITGATSTCFGLRVSCGHILDDNQENRTKLKRNPRAVSSLAARERLRRREPLHQQLLRRGLVGCGVVPWNNTAAPRVQGLTDWCRSENAFVRYVPALKLRSPLQATGSPGSRLSWVGRPPSSTPLGRGPPEPCAKSAAWDAGTRSMVEYSIVWC